MWDIAIIEFEYFLFLIGIVGFLLGLVTFLLAELRDL